MKRVLQSALACIGPLVPIAACAEPISMVCKGTLWAVRADNNPYNGSIIIDTDAKRMTGSFGEFEIVTEKPNFLGFSRQTDKGRTSGGIDRMTGEIDLHYSEDGDKTFTMIWQAKCERAKPLF